MTAASHLSASDLRRVQHDIAVEAVVAGLVRWERGQLRLARCISEIAAAINVVDRLLPSGLVVVLTSSQELVDHVAARWNRTHPEAGYLLTGSHHQSGDLPREAVFTTSSDVISAWVPVEPTRLCLIVGQHRHAALVGEGMLMAGRWADLLIVHEAQHTAGYTQRRAVVHDNKRLPAAARLYTTAAPRIFRRPDTAPADPDQVALSMDEEEVFGPILHEYPAEQAITDAAAPRFRLRINTLPHTSPRHRPDSAKPVTAVDGSTTEVVTPHLFCTHRDSRRTLKVTLAEALTPDTSPLPGKDCPYCNDSTDSLAVTITHPTASNPDTTITATITTDPGPTDNNYGVPVAQTHTGLRHILSALRDWDPAFGTALDAARAHGPAHHRDLLRWITIDPSLSRGLGDELLAAVACSGAHDWWVGYGHLTAHHARTGSVVLSSRHVVHGYPLGEWASGTRSTYVRQGLVLDRYNALLALGAMTNGRHDITQHDLNRQRRWEQHVAAARTFHARYGHLDVDLPGTDAPKTFRNWVGAVRRGHWPLTKAERAALDALGMLWDPPPLLRRKAVAAAFADHHTRHGNLDIPDDLHVDIRGERTRLLNWVTIFRNEHHLGTLHPHLLRTLQDIGFVFDPDTAWWEDLITTARRYHELHGDLDIAPGAFHTAAGECLLTVLQDCRSQWRRKRFDHGRAATLNALDPLWGVVRQPPANPRQPARPKPPPSPPTESHTIRRPVPQPQPVPSTSPAWDHVFAAVQQFYYKHGHIDVPPDLRAMHPDGGQGPIVKAWLNNQRRRLRDGTTTKQQKENLDAVGFIRDIQDAEWMAKYRLACRFHRKRGHLAVTKAHVRENRDWAPLPGWLRTQTRLRAAQRLSDKRIQLLDSIGMPWVGRPGQEHKWEQRLRQVDEFRRTHGHTRILAQLNRTTNPRTREELKALAAWLNDQFVYAKRGTLRSDRRKKLTAIGLTVPTPS